MRVLYILLILNSVFQVLDSEYVVSLLDVFPQGLGFVLVFEYMLSDLGEIIANDANAEIAVRTTTGDPSGSPTYSTFNDFAKSNFVSLS